MGVDVYAYLGVGLLIDRGDLLRDTGRPACGHDMLPGAGGAYCSQCGRPWGDTVEEPVDGYDEGVETFKGFDVKPVSGCEDGRVFVGRVCPPGYLGVNGMRGECERLAGDDLIGLDQQMIDVRKALEDAPFYSKDKFGLWLLTYCSY